MTIRPFRVGDITIRKVEGRHTTCSIILDVENNPILNINNVDIALEKNPPIQLTYYAVMRLEDNPTNNTHFFGRMNGYLQTTCKIITATTKRNNYSENTIIF